MKLSTKAILFSALIYPGSGQLVLKKIARGWVYAISFTLLLAYLLIDVVKTAQILAKKIETGQIPLNIEAITIAVNKQVGELYDLNMIIYSLIFIWALSVVDIVLFSKGLKDN